MQASKAEKARILNEFVATTGFHRKYAITLLRRGIPAPQKKRHRREPTYPAVLDSLLVRFAELLDWPSARHLQAALPVLLDALERHHELVLASDQRAQLLQMSPATIERRLQPFRQKRVGAVRRAPTKPGSLLSAQIPVRTSAAPRLATPGYLEIDLVVHSGPSADGEFIHTPDVVDFATGWNECEPLANRGERTTLAGIQAIEKRLPFLLRGLDSDNDGTFINHHLFQYCQNRRPVPILFTRSRPYRKNDQAHIEQRNWTVVRQYVSYGRYDTEIALFWMRALYTKLRLWQNFFKPVLRLREKETVDGKVRRRYDAPQTPYQRVLASPDVAPAVKEHLTELFLTLNSVALCAEIRKLQDALWAHATVRWLREVMTPLR